MRQGAGAETRLCRGSQQPRQRGSRTSGAPGRRRWRATTERRSPSSPSMRSRKTTRASCWPSSGQLDEASRSIEKAIELAPRRDRSYYNLAELKKISPSGPHLMARHGGIGWGHVLALTADDQIELGFALGKALCRYRRSRAVAFRRLHRRQCIGKREQTFYEEEASLCAAFEDRVNRGRRSPAD